MVAREAGGARRYYHADRLSTRVITDGSGIVVGTQDHLAFGEDASSGETEKHRFTSYERDVEASSDYAVNRQYQNTIGNIGGPVGGNMPGYIHSHLVFFKNGVRTDPRKIFCGK